MNNDQFVEMVRKTFEYVFTIVPKDGWVIEQARDGFVLNNGPLTIFLTWRDGCFIHVLDHSRPGNWFSLLKLYVYRHEPPVAFDGETNVAWRAEREVEKEMYETAKGVLASMLNLEERPAR